MNTNESTNEHRHESHTLKEWRELHFMTQEEFAAFLGQNLVTYRSWEQGINKPHVARHRQMAEKLGIHPSQIVVSSSTKKLMPEAA